MNFKVTVIILYGIFLLLPSISISAQQTSLNGVVAIFNSKFETGNTIYVDNAFITETSERGNPTLTKSDGTFNMTIVGINPGFGVQINVKKHDLEVINTDKLNAISGQLEAVRIFMAPKGKIQENKRKFYQIGKTASEKVLENKISQKTAQLTELKDSNKNNQQAIAELEEEIFKLKKEYLKIDQNARLLAEQFAKINLDDVSELQQRAFTQFQNGNIDSALIILEEVNWESRVDSILTEEIRLLALNLLISGNDSSIQLRRDTLAAALSIAILANSESGKYGAALHAAEQYLQLFPDRKKEMALALRKAAWLSLLADDYPLTLIYCNQINQDTQTELPYSIRYAAYAKAFLGVTPCEEIQSWKNSPGIVEEAQRELIEMLLANKPEQVIKEIQNCIK